MAIKPTKRVMSSLAEQVDPQAAAMSAQSWSEKLNSIPTGKPQASEILGYTGRRAFGGENPMLKQLRKQASRASGGPVDGEPEDNPMHGLALTRIADELQGRLNRTAVGDADAWEDMLTSSEHINSAHHFIDAHHVARKNQDYEKSAALLKEAANHINTAINALPSSMSSGLLSDSYGRYNTVSGTEPKESEAKSDLEFVPWKVDPEEGPKKFRKSTRQESEDFVSLKNVRTDLAGIVGAYHGYIARKTGRSVEGSEVPSFLKQAFDPKNRVYSTHSDLLTLSGTEDAQNREALRTQSAASQKEMEREKAEAADKEKFTAITADEEEPASAEEAAATSTRTRAEGGTSTVTVAQAPTYDPEKVRAEKRATSSIDDRVAEAQERYNETKESLESQPAWAKEAARRFVESTAPKEQATPAKKTRTAVAKAPVDPEQKRANDLAKHLSQLDAWDKDAADFAAKNGDKEKEKHHLDRIANRAAQVRAGTYVMPSNTRAKLQKMSEQYAGTDVLPSRQARRSSLEQGMSEGRT
jgi:hypothetical protein